MKPQEDDKRAASITSDSRFALVTAGHHLLIRLLPFCEPDSYYALTQFVAAVERIAAAAPEVDIVLLRLLFVINKRCPGCVPSCVDRYLALGALGGIEEFRSVVEEIIKVQCIRDPLVRRAAAMIQRSYGQAICTPQQVASAMQVRLSALDVAFKRQFKCTPTEYIRRTRLDQAAILLATTTHSIKEVWVRVGYNHHSNFDHDFKKHFNHTPTEYRAMAMAPLAPANRRPDDRRRVAEDTNGESHKVLVIEDDDVTSLHLTTFLTNEGYSVAVASNGTDGLEMAGKWPPRVVLLDYHLPDMSGLDVLRLLRAQCCELSPPVALFTADWTILDKAVAIREAGAIVASKLCALDDVADLIELMIA